VEKAHAKFSASGAYRWLACPGSVEAEANSPTPPESAAAQEGTQAHAIMEEVLEANIQNVVGFYERTIEDHPEEMLDAVQGYADFVRSEVKGDHYELLIEEKVSLEHIHEDMFGTADTLIIEPFGTLHVVDFKYGKKYVDAEDNEQMAFYAVGAAHKRKWDFENIKVTIYQPRATGKNKRPDRSHTFSVAELRAWEEVFRKGVEAASVPNAPLVKGNHCFFCKAKLTCSEITRSAMAEAALSFDDEIQPDPKNLAPTLISNYLNKAAYLKLWIKDVEAYAEKRLKEGAKIPGYRLREKKAQRKWKNADEVLNSRIGVALLQSDLASPAKAEKILRDSMDFSEETIQLFMKNNVVSVSSGLTLAPDETGEDFLDEDFTPLIE